MNEHMTDADVIRIARQLYNLKCKIDDHIERIADSDHPNAERIADELYDQCWFAAWPEHVIHGSLAHPERWQTGTFGIRRKRNPNDPDHLSETIAS